MLIAVFRGAHAGDASLVSEDEAVQSGLSRSAVAELTESDVAIARGETLEAARLPNPVVSWAREDTSGGSAASTDDYAFLSQPVDFSGRRGLRRQAGERREAGAVDEGAARRIELIAEIRLRFYDTLLAQRRVGALTAWAAEMARVAEIIGRREAAGEVSGFDRRRLEREHAQAEARAEGERATLDLAASRLAAVIGRDLMPASGGSVVAGELPPPSAPRPLDEMLSALSTRPDVRALDASLAAAELEGRAAARWWAPEVTLTGGLKTVEAGGDRATGYTAGIFIPLPIFDRDEAGAVHAAGRARRARAQRALLLAKATGEVRGLHAEATRLIAAARRSRAGTVAASASLIDTAAAAYMEGEVDILALLDAHRGSLEAELHALELEMQARRATIELDLATGGGE